MEKVPQRLNVGLNYSDTTGDESDESFNDIQSLLCHGTVLPLVVVTEITDTVLVDILVAF